MPISVALYIYLMVVLFLCRMRRTVWVTQHSTSICLCPRTNWPIGKHFLCLCFLTFSESFCPIYQLCQRWLLWLCKNCKVITEKIVFENSIFPQGAAWAAASSSQEDAGLSEEGAQVPWAYVIRTFSTYCCCFQYYYLYICTSTVWASLI